MPRANNKNNDQLTFFTNENQQNDTENQYYDDAQQNTAQSVSSVNNNYDEDIQTDAEVAPEHSVQPQKVTFSKEVIPDVVPKKAKSPFWNFDYRKSIILTFIVFITDYLGRAFRHSLFSSIFTSFSGTASVFSESYISKKINSTKSVNARTTLRKKVRKTATNASIPAFISNVFAAMPKIKTRIYGLSLISFGTTALLIHYFIKGYLDKFDSNVYTPITASVIVITSIFLIINNNTLIEAVKGSFFLSMFLFKFLGIKRPQFFEEDEVYFPTSGACIIGGVLGILTLFFPAHTILIAVLAVIYTYVVVKFPETGVISYIMLAPFLEIPALVYITLVITVAYVFKIFTGKRTPRFEFPDIFVFAFLILTFFSELFTLGARPTLLVNSTFILIYFLCIFTLYEKTWFERAMYAVFGNAFLYGIYSIVISFVPKYLGITVDMTHNTDYGSITAGAFDSISVITVILICSIFYIFAAFFTSKSKKYKFTCILLICITLVFILFEASFAMLLAACVGILIFMMLKTSKTMIPIVALAVILPLLPLFSSGIYSGFEATLQDESYRLEIWSSVTNMLGRYWLTGIGSGSEAFPKLYATYFVGNITTVPHAHSLIFQIAISLGVFGLLLFAVIIFFILQGSFSFGRNTASKSSKERLYCYAGMCSVITMVCAGLVENIWYNPRTMLIFWLFCGLTVCARRGEINSADSDNLMLDINENYNG